METPIRTEFTGILAELKREGVDRPAITSRLFELVHRELRRIAAGVMRKERPGHTLEPSALVNEAYLSLVEDSGVDWEDRAHFFGIAAAAMRRVLVAHARRRNRAKRGGGWERITLDEQIAVPALSELAVLTVDRVLTELGAVDPRMERIVELRVFGGMEMEGIARALGVSERTVYNDWRMAKMWLARELSRDDA